MKDKGCQIGSHDSRGYFVSCAFQNDANGRDKTRELATVSMMALCQFFWRAGETVATPSDPTHWAAVELAMLHSARGAHKG